MYYFFTMKNFKVNKNAINHGLITLRFFSSNLVPLKNSHRCFDLRHPERGGLEIWQKRLFNYKDLVLGELWWWVPIHPRRCREMDGCKGGVLSTCARVTSVSGRKHGCLIIRRHDRFSVGVFIFAKGHSSFQKLPTDSPPNQLLSQVLIEFRTESWTNQILHQSGWVETILSIDMVFYLLDVLIPKSGLQEALVQLKIWKKLHC